MQDHKWMVVIGIRDPQMQPSNNVHTLINVSALPKYYNSKASCCYVLYCLLLSNFLKAVCVARKFNGSFPPKKKLSFLERLIDILTQKLISQLFTLSLCIHKKAL